ncbi:MAG: hypothetical protein IPM39_28540 [Chloroflexi bacterium]|nr:hypothetical protein [Chloroflexota bacterium]
MAISPPGDYRPRIIDRLAAQTGGFRRYRYQDELFPSLVFRQAWEALDRQYAPRQADLAYCGFCIWRRVIWSVMWRRLWSCC